MRAHLQHTCPLVQGGFHCNRSCGSMQYRAIPIQYSISQVLAMLIPLVLGIAQHYLESYAVVHWPLPALNKCDKFHFVSLTRRLLLLFLLNIYCCIVSLLFWGIVVCTISVLKMQRDSTTPVLHKCFCVSVEILTSVGVFLKCSLSGQKTNSLRTSHSLLASMC